MLEGFCKKTYVADENNGSVLNVVHNPQRDKEQDEVIEQVRSCMMREILIMASRSRASCRSTRSVVSR